MKKIKLRMNDKIIAFDFNVKLLKNNMLYEIIKAFDLHGIYIDVFFVEARRSDFSKELIEKCNKLTIATLSERNSFAIKATIDYVQLIVEVLSDVSFGELNIWDAYTDWEQYLKDKVPFNPSKNQSSSESKCYLNFNPLEGNKVEVYCSPNYNAKSIHEKLVDIINGKE